MSWRVRGVGPTEEAVAALDGTGGATRFHDHPGDIPRGPLHAFICGKLE